MMMHVEIEKYAGMTSACGLGAYRRPSDETFFVAFHVAAVSMSISQKKGRNKMHSFKEQVSDTCFSLHPFGDWGGVAFADVCSTCSGCYTWDWGGERRFRQVPEKRLETTLLFAPSCFCLRVVLPESPDVTTHILQIL